MTARRALPRPAALGGASRKMDLCLIGSLGGMKQHWNRLERRRTGANRHVGQRHQWVGLVIVRAHAAARECRIPPAGSCLRAAQDHRPTRW